MNFVQLTDVNGVVQIIKILQIVRVHQNSPNWKVVLSTGDPVVLDESEGKKLIDLLLPKAQFAS